MSMSRSVRSVLAPAMLVCALSPAARAEESIVKEAVAPRWLEGGIFSVSLAVQTSPSSFYVIPEDVRLTLGDTPNELRASKRGEWDLPDFGIVPFSFELVIRGDDLSTAEWALTNTSDVAIAYPVSATIYSFDTHTVFDTGLEPSTPGSGPGTPGAIWMGGPGIHQTWFDPNYLWADPCNTGDLYQAVLVQWAELDNHRLFAPGLTARWSLDADFVPAPGTLGMLVVVLLAPRRRHAIG